MFQSRVISPKSENPVSYSLEFEVDLSNCTSHAKVMHTQNIYPYLSSSLMLNLCACLLTALSGVEETHYKLKCITTDFRIPNKHSYSYYS